MNTDQVAALTKAANAIRSKRQDYNKTTNPMSADFIHGLYFAEDIVRSLIDMYVVPEKRERKK